MSKFNEKKAGNPMKENFMGEDAYVLSDKEALTSMVMTTFLTDAYYVSENQLTQNIVELAQKCGCEFTAKLALYARTKGNLRSISHLLAALVCKDSTHPTWLKSFYEHIVVRPDDMSEILSCYGKMNATGFWPYKLRKIPNAMKKGFSTVLSNLSPYQIDKYKMKGKSLSLVDIVNLVHPTPTDKNREAYRRLMHGESLDGTYDSKILEKEMAETGKNASNEQELVLAKHDAIKSVLESGMPMMNLLRNLRNIMLYAPDLVDEAIQQLTNHDKVVNSRLLPFRFMSAYDAVNKLDISDYGFGQTSDSKIEFESDLEAKMDNRGLDSLKSKVRNALEKAMSIACENVPDLEGNCAILIDHSGSVRGDAWASSSVSPWSSVNTAHIGNLFGSIVAFKQKDVYIGMFGDTLISPSMDRDVGLLEFNKQTYDKGGACGGATENGLYTFLENVISEEKHIDNLIVFSDMEIGDGGEGGWDCTSTYRVKFKDLFKEFRKINPNCLTVCCNIRAQSGTSVFNPNLKILNVSGWSNNIFDVISMYKEGKLKSMVEDIENMSI